MFSQSVIRGRITATAGNIQKYGRLLIAQSILGLQEGLKPVDIKKSAMASGASEGTMKPYIALAGRLNKAGHFKLAYTGDMTISQVEQMFLERLAEIQEQAGGSHRDLEAFSKDGMTATERDAAAQKQAEIDASLEADAEQVAASLETEKPETVEETTAVSFEEWLSLIDVLNAEELSQAAQRIEQAILALQHADSQAA